VLGREGELEATRSGGEPCIRLFGDVGGMIVEDRTARSGVVTIIPAGSSARWDIPGLVNVVQLYLPHTTLEKENRSS
jgi:hypothetical protein